MTKYFVATDMLRLSLLTLFLRFWNVNNDIMIFRQTGQTANDLHTSFHFFLFSSFDLVFLFIFTPKIFFIISGLVNPLFIISCPRTSVGVHGRVSVSVVSDERKVRELIMDCVTVPGDPQDVKVTPINSTAIHVEWKPPKAKDQNGVIRGYHIHVQEVREEVSLRLLHDQ